MPLLNLELGVTGVADVVEFRITTDDEERAYPVEYKRGRPKAHRADEVQLCAQALCLEAMFGKSLAEGALFYGKTRRRKIVMFDDALRRLTQQVIHATRVVGRETHALGRLPGQALRPLFADRSVPAQVAQTQHQR